MKNIFHDKSSGIDILKKMSNSWREESRYLFFDS